MQAQPKTVRLNRATIAVTGLESKTGLKEQLRRRLEARSGVVGAFVNPCTEMVYVIYDGKRIHLEDLQHTIEGLGLEAGQLALR